MIVTIAFYHDMYHTVSDGDTLITIYNDTTYGLFPTAKNRLRLL